MFKKLSTFTMLLHNIIITIKNKFLILNKNLNSHLYKKFYSLGIGDWGLGIGDWAQSPIPNPQSPIPNPQTILKKGNFPKLNLFPTNKYLYYIKNSITQNNNFHIHSYALILFAGLFLFKI